MFCYTTQRIWVEENVIYFYAPPAPKYLARKRKFAGNFKIYVRVNALKANRDVT